MSTRRFPGVSPWAALVLLAAIALGLGACGGDDGTAPTVDRVVFEPPIGDVAITAADELTVRVLVDGAAAEADFLVDGVQAARANAYVFVPRELGTVTIEGRVTVDGAEYNGTWSVAVGEVGLRPTPPVTLLRASLAASPGAIALQWERPADGLTDVDIVGYDIAYADRDFAPEEFDDVEVARLDTEPDGPIVQRERIEGLVERQDYTFRLRTRDRVGRLSVPSVAVTSPATGSYRFQGIVRGLRPDRPVAPLANVVVNVGDRFEVTEEDGRFDLPALPDTGEVVLEIAEQSGFQYLEIETDPLPPVDRAFDLLLPENGVVEYVDDGELAGMTRLEFLLVLTGKQAAFPGISSPLYTWADYPVPLYVHPYTFESEIETVDYAAAMADAAEEWNVQAGEVLFDVRMIEQPFTREEIPSPGVVYFADPQLAPPTFGNAGLVEPVGSLFSVVPEIMRVRLLSDFRSNALARAVIVHELGHVLGLRHDSPADIGVHVMVPAVTSDSREVPQQEEALAARFLRHAAGKVEMQWYREPSGVDP